MNIRNWKVITGAILIFAICTAMIVPMFSNTQHQLYVNGEKSNIAPLIKKGQVYVPLSTTVKGMGDNVSYDKAVQVATVKQGKKEIVFTLGNSNVQIDGKNSYLHVKQTKWVTAPTGFNVKKDGNELYVPVESLLQILGYTISVDKDKSTYIIQVGKKVNVNASNGNTSTNTGGSTSNSKVEEDPFVPNKWKTSPTGLYQPIMSAYPLPDGIKPFKAKTTAFAAKATPLENFTILGNELGFVGVSASSAGFLPYGANESMFISYDTDGYYYMRILAWKTTDKETRIVNLTPYAVKSTFELFFGQQKGDEFFNLFDKGMNGDKGIDKYVNTINTVNKRQVEITDYNTSVVIRIGEVGKDFKKTGWK